MEKGKPIVRLKAAKGKRSRTPDLHAGLIEASPDFDKPLNEDFEEAAP